MKQLPIARLQEILCFVQAAKQLSHHGRSFLAR